MKSDLTPTQAEAMAEHHSELSKHRPAAFFQSLNARLAAHQSAGFLTLHDAATKLAAGDETLRKTYHLAMCEAWATGTLTTYDGATRLPIEAPTSEERQRLKGWEALGPSGMRQRLDPNRQVRDLDLVNSADLKAWLKPKPKQATQATPSIVAAPDWHPINPQRQDGLSEAIYKALNAAHECGKPRPKARELLDQWQSVLPAGIEKVLTDEVDYFDGCGHPGKTAGLKAIQKRIERMTRPPAPRLAR